MCMMKSVDYAICVNCIEDMQYKLNIVYPVLKGFVTHTRGLLCSNFDYDKCVQWEDTCPVMIGKNHN